MTNNHRFSVEWKPDNDGDEELDITVDCTGEELWEGMAAILITYFEGAGFDEATAADAAFGAVHYGKKYIVHAIGGH